MPAFQRASLLYLYIYSLLKDNWIEVGKSELVGIAAGGGGGWSWNMVACGWNIGFSSVGGYLV